MKNLLLTIIGVLIITGVYAQKAATLTVENIKTSEAIQIIEAVAMDMNYPLDKFDKEHKVLVTKFIEWTSITVLNHAKLKFEASGDKVVITMIERQYESTEGWTNSLTNLSKKNIKKYLGGFADKMTQISASEDLKKKALENSILIKMFWPVIEKEDLVFTFVRAIKNMEGDKLYQPNTAVEIHITNTKETSVVLKSVIAGFGASLFTGANPHTSMNISSIPIGSGETIKLFIFRRRFEKDIMEELRFSFALIPENKPKISISIVNYNIEIPYEMSSK